MAGLAGHMRLSHPSARPVDGDQLENRLLALETAIQTQAVEDCFKAELTTLEERLKGRFKALREHFESELQALREHLVNQLEKRLAKCFENSLEKHSEVLNEAGKPKPPIGSIFQAKQ
ncbi:MAG: hypothetical protein HWN68_20170 [Desulfobacterales bacterium]|nr:hypothetical protein [Desulfobacterales bacterium]